MIQLPPLRTFGVEIAEVEAKRREIVETRRALRLAESQLPQLEQGVERARGEDTQAAIKARRAGRKDPGGRGEEKAQAELDRLRREIAVLQGVDHALTTEAQEILAKHAEEITQRLKEALGEINGGQLAALAEVEAARSRRLQLQSTLAQVSALVPEPEVVAEGGDFVEVLVHHAADSVVRVDENDVQKVFAAIRAEAGDTAQRDELVAMENPVADVLHLGAAGLPRPAAYQRFKERRAERAASSGT